jgi:similar to spore coat protein
MNSIIESLMGMDTLTDEIIASDMLIAAKTGIKMYAFAITEAATPEVRDTMHRQLQDAIAIHGEITQYMVSKGLYHPYNAGEQIQLDMQVAGTAATLPS